MTTLLIKGAETDGEFCRVYCPYHVEKIRNYGIKQTIKRRCNFGVMLSYCEETQKWKRCEECLEAEQRAKDFQAKEE